jgi:hypothetical protein
MSTRQQIKVASIFVLTLAAWIVCGRMTRRIWPLDAVAGRIPCDAETRVQRMLLLHGIRSEMAESVGPCFLLVNHSQLHEARRIIAEDGKRHDNYLNK